MKANYSYLLVCLATAITSCSGPSEKEQPEAVGATPTAENVTGRWKLEKEEHYKSREKGIEYMNQPTAVILNLEKNGYFILYDTFVSPTWKKKGLPLIQERSKGQWELADSQLKLNHSTADTAYTEVIDISSVDGTKLITKGKDNKSNVYKTYGR